MIAEAISCGTPAVVYDSTACPEIVGEGCGYAVPTGDLDAVLEAVQQIASRGKQEWESACRDHARKTFGKEMLIGETLDLYQRLLGLEV